MTLAMYLAVVPHCHLNTSLIGFESTQLPTSPEAAPVAASRKRRQAPDGYRRPREYAAAAHISVNKIYQMVKDGTLPHVRLGKRTILIPIDALDRMVTVGKP
jgi:excisionase family DNA binding protein